MSHLFESIRVINGQVRNLKYHQKRVDRAYEFYGQKDVLNLRKEIDQLNIPPSGLFKLRISYSTESNRVIKSSITAYEMKRIESLRIAEWADSEKYDHKYEDRSYINESYREKGEADDILFVENGMVLDTSYCNVAFFDGKEWVTPRRPLLEGTMRAKLIEKGVIREKGVSVAEISSFHKVRLFNAMILWSDRKDVRVEKIY